MDYFNTAYGVAQGFLTGVLDTFSSETVTSEIAETSFPYSSETLSDSELESTCKTDTLAIEKFKKPPLEICALTLMKLNNNVFFACMPCVNKAWLSLMNSISSKTYELLNISNFGYKNSIIEVRRFIDFKTGRDSFDTAKLYEEKCKNLTRGELYKMEEYRDIILKNYIIAANKGSEEAKSWLENSIATRPISSLAYQGLADCYEKNSEKLPESFNDQFWRFLNEEIEEFPHKFIPNRYNSKIVNWNADEINTYIIQRLKFHTSRIDLVASQKWLLKLFTSNSLPSCCEDLREEVLLHITKHMEFYETKTVLGAEQLGRTGCTIDDTYGSLRTFLEKQLSALIINSNKKIVFYRHSSRSELMIRLEDRSPIASKSDVLKPYFKERAQVWGDIYETNCLVITRSNWDQFKKILVSEKSKAKFS